MIKHIFLLLLATMLLSCQPDEVVTPVDDSTKVENWHSFELTSDDRFVIVTYYSNVRGIDMMIAASLEEVQNPTAQTIQKHWDWTCVGRWAEISFRPVYVRIVSPDGYDEVKILEQ